MFDINKLVFDTLKPLDIPVYFCARKENRLPVVIFNVTSERGYNYWDDEEKEVKYKVCINLFSKGNFIKHKNQILKLMRDAGFKREDVPECIYQEDTEIFNQPVFFSYINQLEEKSSS